MRAKRTFACVMAFAALSAPESASAKTLSDEQSTTNPDAGWSQAVNAAISSDPELLALVPSDVMTFCPNFPTLDLDGRAQFWTYFMTRLADEESGGDPTYTHWSVFDFAVHRPTFRRGLFQLSIEAAHSRRYQCDVAATNDLTSPAVNTACAVKILKENVSASGVIAGARYWPTLSHRNRRAALAHIIASAPPCAVRIEEQP